MSAKIILCRCEDVTLADVEHAIEAGYRDIESIKRYTAFGTGSCQGKECLRIVAAVIASRTGADPGTVSPFTTRPPLTPAPLKSFAGDGK
jgi:sarcosine oxidase subunit beta